MKKIIKLIAVGALVVGLSACGKNDVQLLVSSDKIVIVGDDLTLGTGGKGTTFPVDFGAFIGNWVVNEGKAGETASTASKRLDEILAKNMPSHLVIAVGGVDMQQKRDDAAIENDLREMIVKAKEQNVIPILMGQVRPSTPGSNLKMVDAAFYGKLAKSEGIFYIQDAFSSVLDQAKYRATPTLLNADGYIEVAKIAAMQFKEAGFVKELNGLE